MPRNSSDADKKLLKAGRTLLIKKGVSKLSIREVAEAARVNLGMFNYYFGTKDKFIEAILDEIYEEFISNFELEEKESKLETLEYQLTLIAKFARDNRHLVLALISDILNDEQVVKKFARVKMKRHFLILAKTIRSCQKSELLVDAPLIIILSHIIGSIGLSSLLPGFLIHLDVNMVFDLGTRVISKNLLTDEALEKRVHIAISGLKRK